MDILDCDHKEQDTTADNMAGASDEELREVDIIDDKQAGTELGQAQLQLELGFTLISTDYT